MLINIFWLLYLSLEFVCISPLAMGGFLCFPLSYNISIGGRRSQLATGACSSEPAFDKEIQFLLSKTPTWADCKISRKPDVQPVRYQGHRKTDTKPNKSYWADNKRAAGLKLFPTRIARAGQLCLYYKTDAGYKRKYIVNHLQPSTQTQIQI